MLSGPVTIMKLEKANGIREWRELMGPTDSTKARESHPHSIRALFGKDCQSNAVHGSDSKQSAEREINLFFESLS